MTRTLPNLMNFRQLKPLIMWSLTLLTLVVTPTVFAAPDIPLFSINDTGAGQEYSTTLQILLLLTSLSFLPALLLVLTSFTRIVIVLSLLRQAIGLQQSPPNQIIIGLSLFLTFFIMQPVFDDAWKNAVEPWMAEELTFQQAAETGIEPFRGFMIKQTRPSALEQMVNIADLPAPDSVNDVPLSVLVPAFVISELTTAFQIGFMIFIPFLVIDMVVASVLMAMGMMMLSPLIVSLPFKIMLFVLIDGWALIVGTLAASFQ